MVNYELERVLSAIRSLMVSSVGKEVMYDCRAIEMFDACYDQIRESNESEILFDLGVTLKDCGRCPGCKDLKK